MKEIWHDTWWEKFQKKNKCLQLCFPFITIGSDSPSLYRNMCKYRFESGQYKGFGHSTIIKPSCHLSFLPIKDARHPQFSFVAMVEECALTFTFFNVSCLQ